MANCFARSSAACSDFIDYSTVQGERILPFTIALDLEKSILEPQTGENQRFCYQINGVGQDVPTQADLSHILFGICADIPASQLANITVTRNGIEENVVFGQNVELKTEEKPDPPTGCPGLKFDFGLNKQNGVMLVCFELLETYPIGEVTACLYGGGVTANSLSICGPACQQDTMCPAVGEQEISVCVPVTVTPYAMVGATVTRCVGTPVITPGATVCPGVVNGSCSFTISQRLHVSVPVSFGARAVSGDHSVNCDPDEDLVV
ncbi:MAG: hypothetical protein PHI98_14135 [Eubacteriales bacterium]|nr:hypothetical protein [Eubacteriales bacterium]